MRWAKRVFGLNALRKIVLLARIARSRWTDRRAKPSRHRYCRRRSQSPGGCPPEDENTRDWTLSSCVQGKRRKLTLFCFLRRQWQLDTRIRSIHGTFHTEFYSVRTSTFQIWPNFKRHSDRGKFSNRLYSRLEIPCTNVSSAVIKISVSSSSKSYFRYPYFSARPFTWPCCWAFWTSNGTRFVAVSYWYEKILQNRLWGVNIFALLVEKNPTAIHVSTNLSRNRDDSHPDYELRAMRGSLSFSVNANARCRGSFSGWCELARA